MIFHALFNIIEWFFINGIIQIPAFLSFLAAGICLILFILSFIKKLHK
jgi:hypothetical protein